MNNTIDVQICGNQGMFPCTYKTVVLKPNIINDKNILNQGMMNMPNTKYVIKYDFLISDAIVTKTANVVSTNVSQCGNSAYATALANYNAAHEAWIEADNAYTNNPNDTTLAAKNAAYAALEAAQLVLNGTPQYYYFASGAINLKKGQYVSVPDGCVLLNGTLNGLVDFILAPSNTTVYIGSAVTGIYEYTVLNGIDIPANCLIEFDGGSISDGVLVCDDTILIFDQEEEAVLKNVTLLGDYEYSSLTSYGFNKKDNVNGMAIITLKKNKSFVEQLTQTNTIYRIMYDYDLNGESITIPTDCILVFDGGSLSNGTLIGNNTYLKGNKALEKDIVLSGDFLNEEFNIDIFNISENDNISSILNVLLQLRRNIRLPQGSYYCDGVDIPASFAGCIIKGSGYNHYGVGGTKLFSTTATYMFKYADGADRITVSDIGFYGENIGTKGIDGSFGAFNTFISCGFYRFTEHGIYSRQGLLRIDNVFCAGNDIGLDLWSDSSVVNSEFTGGRIPLKISAGGDRLSNIWANSGTECCLLLERQNGYNHDNTSLVNMYVGETYSTIGEEKPVVVIKGFASNPVEDVQFSNSFIVGAMGTNRVREHLFDIQYVEKCCINNVCFRGYGPWYSSDRPRLTMSSIKIQNSKNVSISNNIFRDNNKNVIILGAYCEDVNITNNIFTGFGNVIDTPTDGAAIIGASAGLRISGNMFYTNEAGAYAFEPTTSIYFSFENNVTRFPNAKVVGGDTDISFSYKRHGEKYTRVNNYILYNSTIANTSSNFSKRNYLKTHEVVSAGSGASVNLLNISDYEGNNTVYLISATQKGTGANSVFGLLMIASIGTSVITTAYNNTGNADNEGVYKKKFAISDGKLIMELGTAYGQTTWVVCITPL